MSQLPTQLSSIIANVWATVQMNDDDDNTDWEISNHQSDAAGVSTLSSDIEQDELDIWQEVLHPDQARRDETLRTTRVPLPKQGSRADTVIACTRLPNLRHSFAAIVPPLLKRHKSAINISRESDVVQALLLPMAGGDHNVPQPMAGGDHNVPQHQKATFEGVK